MAGGLLLMAAALLLSGWNLWDEHRAATAAQSVLAALPTEMRTGVPASPSPVSVQEPEIPDYILAPNMEMPTVEIDGQLYIGVLEIPALALELPIISQWSYPALHTAPCRYDGSAYQDDLIIAAHNYRRHFGALKELTPGDAVLLTDADGNVFRYAVAELELLGGGAVEEMHAGDWDLTLFTCTYGGQSRVTVRCLREDTGI